MILKNCSRRLAVLLFFSSFLTAVSSRADIPDGWHWRNPKPFSDTMYSVCFGEGEFVAVGDGGVVHVSSDGVNWDDGHRPTVFTLNKVIYANGEFVAVGNSGAVVTSTNGVDWTAQNTGASNDLYAVAYGNGKFVACGLNGQLATSSNGIDWTLGTNNSVGPSWITFGNGVFVAAGSGTSVEISSDGQSWASNALPVGGFSWPHALFQAEYGNGLFVAVVGDESNPGDPLYAQPASHFYTSADGTNWTQKSYITWGPDVGGGFVSHRFFVFLNGAFHEMTDGNEYGIEPISVTTDGTSFTTEFAPTNAPNAQSMAYGNGKYLLIEQSGKTWVSSDETNWTTAYFGVRAPVWGLVQGVHSNLLAVGPMLISSNGVDFNGPNAPADQLRAAASDGTNYVVVGGFTGGLGGASLVYTSTNGVNWVQRTGNASYGLNSVCYASNRWVAVGGNGTVISSPNTLAWTLRTSGTGSTLNAVTSGNGLFVAVGSSGTVITSSDGATWDVQYSGTVNNLLGVAFRGGQFVAVGENGTILTSPDAVDWMAQSSGTNTTLYTIAYGNSDYLVGGYDGAVGIINSTPDVFLTSTNGTNWQTISAKIPTASPVHSIAYLNNSFWVLGENGMILQSDVADGIPHFAGSMMPGNGGMKLNVTLNPAASYRVQFCTNLLTDTWHDVYTNTSPISSTTWTDTNNSKLPSGFYRVVSP